MAQKEDVMRVMYERCCGLDIHKSSITACALISEKGKTQEETRRFGTMTGDLRELAGWLQQKGIRHVVMESTCVYWKPVWNILGRYAGCNENFVLVTTRITAVLSFELRVLSEDGNGAYSQLI